MQALFGACIIVLCVVNGRAEEGGYLSSLSVTKGDTLRFHISTTFDTFSIGITRLGAEHVRVATIDGVHGGLQPLRDSAYALGCGWKVTAALHIPDQWSAGMYSAEFPTTSGMKRMIFCVRERVPGSTSKMLVSMSSNTWQAYNSFGGKSLYDFNSTNTTASYKVSFERPFTNWMSSLYFKHADKLIRWIEKEHIDYETCMMNDLDADPSLLDAYDVFVIGGHSEYWSRTERTAIQHFVDRGGRIIVLGGNTCWWQVRFEDGGKTMVCYKSANRDPLYGIDNSVVTENWGRDPINEPENSLIGVSFEHGGYVNHDSVLLGINGSGGYTVFHSDDWIFRGTNVRDGDIFGHASAIVGYEVDGALYYWGRDSMMALIGADRTPRNFRILGLSPAASESGGTTGAATMGYYIMPNGGAVFNAATINWSDGLAMGDTTVEWVTRNVMRRFRSHDPFPPQVVSYAPRMMTSDSINAQHVFTPHRVLHFSINRNDTLVVHALDPQGLPLTYSWRWGKWMLGTDSVLVLDRYKKMHHEDESTATVTISNGFDSTTLDWRFIDTAVVFTSFPSSTIVARGDWYVYRPHASAQRDEHPKITMLSGPRWLQIDRFGTLSGRADTTVDEYPVTLAASDNRGHTTTQSFTVTVINAFADVSVEANEFAKPTVSPNPFNTASNVTFACPTNATVTVALVSEAGVIVRTLCIDERFAGGTVTLRFDGAGDDGRPLACGLYLCRIVIRDADGRVSTYIRSVRKV